MKCMVTGETISEVVEAAHISPYDGRDTNSIENGLLLRVDIHKLFDKYLLSIHPELLRVVLNPDLSGSGYAFYEGVPLTIDKQSVISNKNLRDHWNQFSSV